MEPNDNRLLLVHSTYKGNGARAFLSVHPLTEHIHPLTDHMHRLNEHVHPLTDLMHPSSEHILYLHIHHMVLFLRESLDGDGGAPNLPCCPTAPPSSFTDPLFAVV